MQRRPAFPFPTLLLALIALVAAAPATFATPDENPFEHGWTLDNAASELQFISVKKGNIAESHRFTQLSGQIDEAGNANVSVVLNSVQTRIDIRDVRLRFLFFQTYLFPEARISLRIDRGMLGDLAREKRKIARVEYTLDLHGEQVTRPARVTITLLDNDRVAVANTDPIIVGVSDFNLLEGVRRLETTANVDVSPLAIVSFDFTFRRNPETPRAPARPAVETAASARTPALIPGWSDTNPDLQSCMARILQLSRLDRVRFDTAETRIDDHSTALLQAYAEALNRCPAVRVRITGLTGPGESPATSPALAMQRAQAVSRYLWSRGVQRSRMEANGGGQAPPDRPGRILFTITN